MTPGRVRYAPLLDALRASGGSGESELPGLVVQELEVYARPQPPPGYSLGTEVDALLRLADSRGWPRVHLYGSSYGGSVALAFTAAHPDRVSSLTLDEPATDFSEEDRAEPAVGERWDDLAPEDRLRAFFRYLVRPEADLAPPPTPPADLIAVRAAGLAAASATIREYPVDLDVLRGFERPVHYSYGGLSNPRWEAMAGRLSELFPDCVARCYPNLHHLNSCHHAEPERVAEVLRELWARADRH
jgi:pimeloyl-ACP methyl ester carboxylesterase